MLSPRQAITCQQLGNEGFGRLRAASVGRLRWWHRRWSWVQKCR